MKLEKQPLDILILLVQRRGELITREEIRNRLWADDVFLDADQGINNGIRKIRLALGDDSDDPKYVETVVGRGYRFKAEIKNYQSVYLSQDQKQVHIEAVPVEVGIEPKEREPRKRVPSEIAKHLRFAAFRRTVWIFPLVFVAVVAVLFMLNVAGFRDWVKGSLDGVNVAPRFQIKIRRSVAVVGFKNLSQRSEAVWLSTALAEMLTTELAAGGQLRIVSGENIARAKRDLSLSDNDSYAPDTLLRLQKILGTDLIVTGSYSDLGGMGAPLRLDLRIQEAATGETKVLVSETGTKNDLFPLVSHSGSDLRQKLGIAEIATIDLASVQASYPPRPDAARWYAEGQEKLRANDALGAKTLLEKALSVEPSFPLAHSALAIAWSALGYDLKAAEEGKTAFELSGNLSREERLLVEARYREVTKQWSLAAAIYHTLNDFVPDQPDYGLSLARAYILAGNSKEAQTAVSNLRSSGVLATDDPRLLLAEAGTASAFGSYEVSMQRAREAAVSAAAQGARFQLARARALEGTVRWRVGDAKGAIGLLTEAKEIYSAVGNQSGQAQALHDIGTSLFVEGDLEGAERTLQEAASIRRKIGEKYGLSRTVNNMGNVLQMKGDLDGAKTMFAEALSLAREVGNKNTVSASLDNLATVLSQEGEYEAAEKETKESIAIARDIGDKISLATGLTNLANIRFMVGDLTSAWTEGEEALAIAQQSGFKTQSAYSLEGLGDVAAARGDLAESDKKYRESLALWTATNQKIPAAQILLAQGKLLFDEGQLTPSEAPIREAIDEFHTNKIADGEIFARALLGSVLVTEGRRADARIQVDNATQLATKCQDRDAQLILAIATAKVSAAEGHAGRAEEVLASELRGINDRARLDLRYQAKIVIAEIETAAGKTAAGSNRFLALEKEATKNGFLLIAKQASKERSSCCMRSQSLTANTSSVRQ